MQTSHLGNRPIRTACDEQPTSANRRGSGYTTHRLLDVLDSPDTLWPILVRFLTMSNMHAPGNNDRTQTRDHHDDEHGPDTEPTIREGLPPTYRMRADAHYVEQLDAPAAGSMIQCLSVAAVDIGPRQLGEAIPALVDSIKRHGILQPLLVQRWNGETRLIDGRKRLHAAITAGLREVPCLVRDIDDRESAVLVEESNVLRSRNSTVSSLDTTPSPALDIHDALVRAIADIDSCTHLLSSSASSLPQRVGSDLIRAEVWRASCLLQASRIVQHGVPPGQGACSARRLITSVAERAEAERRLRGYALHIENEIPESLVIAGDPSILGAALSGLLLATCAVADDRPGARIALTGSVDATREIEFAVSEVGTGVSTSWESRAFDPTWSDRPGRIPAAVWMMAARKVSESYGGRVTVSVTSRGATAKMIMPIAAA